ncbi:FAD-dependent oxidoreductase [Arcanobacterium ihumii]|uniref:FAD-dependent oxidoreductase n=1 Tax=Arcanobacterium ihumii TaxID=2138162 RepID=UPI000F51E358|nr:FAD-dependent oxidoreductase [Arcanobacterium ihumii]
MNAYNAPSKDAYDVVVVGTGAAGLTAALTAARRGMSVLLVEKSSEWGGSTAKSAGMVWIPGNNILAQVGKNDSIDLGRQYMKATVGDCTSDEMIEAFLVEGTKAMDFLSASCPELEWRNMEGYPDYWLDAPGAAKTGRGVEAGAFDTRLLGEWESTHVKSYFRPMISLDISSFDSADLLLFATNPKPLLRGLKLTLRNAKQKLRGEKVVTMGAALTGAIMHNALKNGVEVKLETAIIDLIRDGDRVTGIVLEQRGRKIEVKANHGVILACGGFERNDEMRKKYQRHPINGEWTVGVEGNTGDGIEIGVEHGAAISNMADAIWSPVIQLPQVKAFAPIVIDDVERFIVPDRSLPHTMIVNGKGKRFMNEALPYCTAGQGLYGGHFGKGEGDAENLPAWLIFDQQFRNKYMFSYGYLPIVDLPQEFYDSGAVIKRDTIEELAEAINVPVVQLKETLDRFNSFARTGVDEDFHRGEDEHDRFYGNRYHKPNPSLGEIKKGPFYATGVYPGDIGTSGGLVIDTKARVTREDGSIIEGLYAAGNTTKSVIGHTYTAGGTSIGAAIAFGHVAANTIADQLPSKMVAH